MQHIIFDLEATCWAHRIPMNDMEIIEIGAVKLNEDFSFIGEFSSFVKPIINPVLSDFCKKLTTIKQTDVDAAEDFKIVFPKFLNWIGNETFTLHSWGIYDIKQITIDCVRHNLFFPESFKNHINLKQRFSAEYKIKPCGMHNALNKLGFNLDGVHHRGIDDAKNIAKIAQVLLSEK